MTAKIKMMERVVMGLTTFLLVLLENIMNMLKRMQRQTRQPPPPPPHPHTHKVQLQLLNDGGELSSDDDERYSRGWRLAVEANNVLPWKTVPLRCYNHVRNYMTGGQYEHDLKLIVDQILLYASQISLSSDGFDAWILDVDDTCISNMSYYRARRFGCDPFDSAIFKAWIMKGMCPANPVVLGLFKTLKKRGFKVFLLTGRYEATLGKITMDNLINQGFTDYDRLILRSAQYMGQNSVKYKSAIRREIEKQGYRIWGNVGDQWSDLQGDCLGNRTFKIPNPMYCIS